ncbi:MAG: peptidoglycan-binding protein [Elainellaceae cyanobacterium]
MESLAFVHHAVIYDDPESAQLTLLKHVDWRIPSSAWTPLVSILVFLAVLNLSDRASAQTLYQRGSRGSAVTEIQKALEIPADGIYGPVTEAAVRDYQRQENLDSIDGKAGPETLESLGLLDPSNQASESQVRDEPRQASVSTPTGVGINVRRTPNGDIVNGLPDGAPVLLTGREQPAGRYIWAELMGGRWVAKDYLRFSNTPSAMAVSFNAQAATSQSSNSPSPRRATVSTNTGIGLNLRNTPSGQIMGSVPNGTPLSLTRNEQPAGEYVWAETTNGQWVAKEFLSYSEPASATTAQTSTEGDRPAVVATRSGVGVNVRDTPNGTIIGGLPDGTTVSATETEQPSERYTWVRTNRGWIAKEFLQFRGSTGGNAIATSEQPPQESTTANSETSSEPASDTNANANANANVDTDTDTEANANANADTDVNAEANAEASSEASSEPASDTNANANANADNSSNSTPAIANQSSSANQSANQSTPNEADTSDQSVTPSQPSANAIQSPTSESVKSPSDESNADSSPGLADSSDQQADSASEASDSDVSNVDASNGENSSDESAVTQPSDESGSATTPSNNAAAPELESFTTSVDPRRFKGPQGTFSVKRETERRANPDGESVGEIAASDTVSVTDQRKLADGSIWAQLEDGTWIDSAAIDVMPSDSPNPSPTP